MLKKIENYTVKESGMDGLIFISPFVNKFLAFFQYIFVSERKATQYNLITRTTSSGDAAVPAVIVRLASLF